MHRSVLHPLRQTEKNAACGLFKEAGHEGMYERCEGGSKKAEGKPQREGHMFEKSLVYGFGVRQKYTVNHRFLHLFGEDYNCGM